MKMHATRLQEGQDLKQEITNFIVSQGLSSAAIVSVVGSLSIAVIRMAGAQPDRQDVRTYEDVFEIVSLVGTVAHDGAAHLHISISDSEGKVIGGHLKDGSIIHTTAELVVVSEESIEFARKLDSRTGFDELTINPI